MPLGYDPYGRLIRQPSLNDYQELALAYRRLQANHEQLVETLQGQQARLERQAAQIAQLERDLKTAKQAAARSAAERSHAGEQVTLLTHELQRARQRIADMERDLSRQQSTPVYPGTREEDCEDAQVLARQLQQSEARIVALEHQAQQAEDQAARLEASIDEARPQASQAVTGEATDWRERYLRLQAELENFKKRQQRRFAQEAAADRERILLDMLPLADHLELGLQHLKDHSDATSSPLMESYLDNLESTRRAFLEALKRHGIDAVDAAGQAFNPQVHEALGQVPSTDVAEGDVVQVVQAGYMDGDRLLRPARVLVSSGSPV